ncbi:hypothetical protein ABN584_16410 [Gloeocapsa sp. BRSZ]
MKFKITMTVLLLVSIHTKAVFALPLSQKTPSSTTEKKISFEVDAPLCYMRTATGSILDLSNLCEAKLRNTTLAPVRRTNNVYDPTKTRNFDRQLYRE